MPRIRKRIHSIPPPPFDPLTARAAEIRAAGHDVISLGQAVPFFPPPEAALNAAREAIGRPDLNRYITDPGLPSLRAALAERLAPMVAESALTPSDIMITTGANQAFTLVLNTVVDPGDEVIVHAPYFTNHYGAIVAAGAIPVEAPVADHETFALTWSDLEPHVTTRTRAVVLCNPSNPTGAPVDAVNGGRIVRELARRDVTVISDETYMHFVYDGEHWSAAAVPGWRRNVIVIGTFSKSFGMMGWRLGFVVADAAVCAQAVKVQDAMIICAPALSQVAGEAAVRECWAYPLTFRDEMRSRRELVAELLPAIPRLHWTPTGGALFGFVRVEGCTDSARLSHDLLEQAHVITIPGAAFGTGGEGYLRLSYGFAGRAELIEAFARIRHFLA
jgi:aminotransferase